MNVILSQAVSRPPAEGTQMFTKTLARALTLFLVFPALGQTSHVSTDSAAGLEFPVILRQNVTAGATAVGTRVRGKLTLATLVNGVVIPPSAILSGEVIESASKSATSPSRLAIRLESAQWKNGSVPAKLDLPKTVYLTVWYYPVTIADNHDSSPYSAADPVNGPRPWSGSGNIRNNPLGPAATRDPSADPSIVPPPPGSEASQHRVVMKDVEAARNPDGALMLTSTQSNIKLDKTETYVFASGGLLPLK
jgi:hypothetical protein